jgi:hypothetical protein
MPCECDSCRLGRAFREEGLKDLSAAEVAHMVYWAVTCARCGGQIIWNGVFDDMAVCAKCDAEITEECAFYQAQKAEAEA